MSLETFAQVARRINEHAATHNLESVEIVFHGGEPFLLPLDYLDEACQIVRINTPDTKVLFRIQSNVTMFDQSTLDFCLKWQFLLGTSIDGPKEATDRHRIDHQKRSSYDAVLKALQLLSTDDGRKVWSGILSVIDLRNDPIETYDFLRSWSPPSIEFLLPLGHYDLLPPGKNDRKYSYGSRVMLPMFDFDGEADLGPTPYADWLIEIFNQWYRDKSQRVVIRRFKDIIALMLHGNRSSEEWGLQPVDFAVVETNGDIQAVDTLKVTYSGANHLGLNVFEHSFDDMFESPLVRERQNRWSKLCTTCKQCNLMPVCGGGYFPHRYSSANGFDNPSIYCDDLKKLLHTVHSAVAADLLKIRGRLPTATS